MRRKLTLRRETLTDLELREVSGGSRTELCLGQTEHSCLDHISCYDIMCLTRRDSCVCLLDGS